MSLSNDQLSELTERVNGRLAEWELPHNTSGIVERLPKGIVRLVHDVIEEWQNDDGLRPVKDDGRPELHAWAEGYARGRETARHEGPPGYRVMSDFGGMSQTLVPDSLVAHGDQPAATSVAVPEPERSPKSDEKLTREDEQELTHDGVIDLWSNDDSDKSPALSDQATATLGPEHTVVTPYREPDDPDHIGPRKQRIPLPDPDQARERLAHGSNGNLAQAITKPRTLAEVDGLEGDGDDELDQDEGESKRQYKTSAAVRQRAKGRRGNVLPTREQLIAEVQRQAMAGYMPSIPTFDKAKPANWASAAAHMQRFGITWNQLADEAGLKPNRLGPRQLETA